MARKINYDPSIMIWKLQISDKNDRTICQDIYFLSRKRAKKFWDKHKEELKDCHVSLGGEQLWLW